MTSETCLSCLIRHPELKIKIDMTEPEEAFEFSVWETSKDLSQSEICRRLVDSVELSSKVLN